MCAGEYPLVNEERAETRDTEDNNKGGGPIPPINRSFKVNSK